MDEPLEVKGEIEKYICEHINKMDDDGMIIQLFHIVFRIMFVYGRTHQSNHKMSFELKHMTIEKQQRNRANM